MTLIENDSPKVQYTGPFSKGQLLPLTFPYIATEDVKMIIDDKPAIFNVDYEIITEPNDEHPVAYPNSAYIKSDLPDAKQITIYRSTPLDQQAPFPQMSKFRSERIEQALDKLTMQQQEQVEQLSRCIIAPITLETFNGQLPAPAADQALKWNSEGTELENYDIIGEQEAFETEVNTKFEEQSTAIETRIGQFEEETNTQFSDFRNEINENLDAVLNAAGKLDTLEQQVQAATDAANAAITSAAKADEYAEEVSMAVTKADEYAEEASMSATKAEDTLEEIKQVIQDAEANIGNTVTDALNNKVDLDGGNYVGSPLEEYINTHHVSFNLFDIVLKDHILPYEESKGLALQGTYVYKEAIAGSRYGYPDFYNKVIDEYTEATQTETINGVTVTVHPNGHKFYNIANKKAIDEFYNSMGTAWMYGVDTENERIFLPRDKYFAIKGNASVVGNGMGIGLTDGITNAGWTAYNAQANSAMWVADAYGQPVGTITGGAGVFEEKHTIGVTTDPNKSGLEAHLQANEEKYLYICVGNTTNYEGVTDVVNQGMEILEQVNQGIESRVKVDGSNAEFPYITQTYVNGTSGYNIYSNGYCEQWGYVTAGANPHAVTLLKEYANTDYNIVLGDVGVNAVGSNSNTVNKNNKTNSSFQVYLANTSTWECYWHSYGYLAEGEY